MQGERGTLIYLDINTVSIQGEKGPKGFPGREGESGSKGYLRVFFIKLTISYYNNNIKYISMLI